MKISVMLKETFIDAIESMVDCGEVSPERVAGTDNCIRKTIDELQTENKALTSKVASLEKQIEQTEQYSRRNCLRISDLKEETNEDTDALFMSIASTIG